MPVQKTVKKETIQALAEYFKPIAQSKGFELFDVEFVKEGSLWYLRVFIDKETGITIDDCEAMSRAVEKVLDEKDPIPQAYILEVSSPGIDRPLKSKEDYERYSGKTVDVKLYKAADGQKEFQGVLLGKENGVVTIKLLDGRQMNFTEQEIAICRLAVLF